MEWGRMLLGCIRSLRGAGVVDLDGVGDVAGVERERIGGAADTVDLEIDLRIDGDGFAAAVVGRVRIGLSARNARSEEHTSELKSHSDLVCRLLLENKNRDPVAGDG